MDEIGRVTYTSILRLCGVVPPSHLHHRRLGLPVGFVRFLLKMRSQILHERLEAAGELGLVPLDRLSGNFINVGLESFEHSRFVQPHRLGDRVFDAFADFFLPDPRFFQIRLELLNALGFQLLEQRLDGIL